MRKRICIVIAAGIALSALADVKRVAAPPAIDGVLDEHCWESADWEDGFLNGRTAKDREPVEQTSFAILADDENIYLGFRANHRTMNEMKAVIGKRSLWVTEAVEFDLAPDGTAFSFYKFLVKFDGGTFAQFYSENGLITPDPYGPAWESKTKETAEGWCGEVRIPLSAFYMTRGAEWRTAWKMNVGRCVVANAKNTTFSCWADAMDFNDVKNYRTMSGFPVRAKAEDVCVRSAAATVGGRSANGFSGSLKLFVYAAQGGRFRFETPYAQPHETDLGAGENEVEFAASFPEEGRLNTPIRLVRLPGGTACERTYPLHVEYAPIRLKLLKPSFRGNFYPGQDSSAVEGVVSVMDGEAATVEFEGPGTGRIEAKPDADGRFRLGTAAMTEGTGVLTVRSGDRSYSRKIRKIESNPHGGGVAWVENGTLMSDGKPVLRRNLYAQHYMGGEAFGKKYDSDNLHLTKDLAFCGTLEPGRLIKGLELKEATRDVKPCDELFRAIDKVVENGIKKPGGYYYINDEPECRNVSPYYLKHIYDYVAEKDPYHVILTASRAGERYIDCADWFETHPYLNPHYIDGVRTYTTPFAMLGSFVDAFKPEEHPDKCVGALPTCFAYATGDYPTFNEYVANVWCFFLRGAKTLRPYAYHDLGDRASIYEGTRYTFSSAEALQDFILLGERRTLARTDGYEAAVWTLPSGERLFAAVNFLQKPQKISVKNLDGELREFRGDRKFAFSASGTTLAMRPLETVVATTSARGDGLPSLAEARALVDRLEAKRRGRDNQLMDPGIEKVVTSSGIYGFGGDRKLYDGTRGVLAWMDKGKNGYCEIAFPKKLPRFDSLAVFGRNVKSVKVKVRKDGEWKELSPQRTDNGEYSVLLRFGETFSTVKLRLEFPAPNVELYEIEMPRVAGAAPQTTQAASAAAPAHLDAKSVAWVCDVPKGAMTSVWWRVARDRKHDWLVFEVRDMKPVKDGRYTNWTMGFLNRGTAGHVARNVVRARPGLYVVKMPPIGGDADELKETLKIWNYNFALDMGPVACVAEPGNRVEFSDRGDSLSMKVVLAAPCEDLSCNLFSELENGLVVPYPAGGSPSVQLKPDDLSRRVWSATLPCKPPVDGAKRPPLWAKVTVLGGSLDKPIYANATKGE